MNKKTKKWLMIAASLVLVGCIIFGGAMTMAKWDFMKLSTTQYEANKHEIHDDYKNIAIVTNTADVVFAPSETAETIVVCHEQKNIKHAVTVKDNTLVVEVEDTRKWYEYIGINFGSTSITVYIPQAEYGAISVKASTGDIQVENLSAENLDMSVSTGKITASHVTCKGDITVHVSTGRTMLTDIACKNLVSTGDTGDMSLKQVTAAEKFSLKRSTGDILFDGCDAAEILAQTDTGDVKGSLLTDKVFITETSTGKINVPKTTTGGRCEITTSTGDIKIEISHS